jgi:hypothetical protein
VRVLIGRAEVVSAVEKDPTSGARSFLDAVRDARR